MLSKRERVKKKLLETLDELHKEYKRQVIKKTNWTIVIDEDVGSYSSKETANKSAMPNDKAAAKERRAAEKKAAKEKKAAEKERRAAEKAREAAEKAAAKERRAADKAAEKAREAAEKRIAQEKEAAEKRAAQAAAEARKATEKRAAQERRAAERLAAREKKAAERLAAKEKRAAERLAAREKKAAEKARKAVERKAAREKAVEKAKRDRAKTAAVDEMIRKKKKTMRPPAKKTKSSADVGTEASDVVEPQMPIVDSASEDSASDDSASDDRSNKYRSNFHNAFPVWASKNLDPKAFKYDKNMHPHQAIPSRFINTDTPYRGLLLYHGLGSGKTRTAISIAETGGFGEIIVILPAALETNFKQELQAYRKKSPNSKSIDYEFIRSNGLTVDGLQSFEDGHFDNKLIIIDEVHNITSGTNPEGVKMKLYNKLLRAENSKFVLMSGTPMINHPVEISNIINLLRGKQFVYSTTVSGDVDPKKLTDALLSNEYILTSEVSQDQESSNYLVKFALTPPQFIRSQVDNGLLMKIKKPVPDRAKLKKIVQDVKKKLKSTKNKTRVILGKVREVENLALPRKPKEFDEQFRDRKTDDIFKRRVAGSVSYYSQKEDQHGDDQEGRKFAKTDVIDIELPMTDHQFKQYKLKRGEEIKSEKSNSSNSVYKVYSRAVSNFAFPDKVQRVFPKDLRVFVNDTLDRDSAEDLVSFYSILNKKSKVKSNAGYQDKVKIIIDQLSNYFRTLQTDDKLIETLKEKLSPKFADIYEKIVQRKGISMVYSDFKNVEGIQIMKLVLENKGICELNIVKQDGAYRFKPRGDCKQYYIHYGSSPKVDINRILLQIANNELNEIKKEHKELFADIKRVFPGIEDDRQVHGEFVKCVLLTKSGSEGISLKNIRSVFIVEPYWNNIRLKQVIGRAVRMNSHAALRPEERNVKIFKYKLVFSDDQKKETKQDKHALKNDDGLTSDQMIERNAKTKTEQIERFEELLQQASIDCMIHSKSKKRKKKCLQKNPDRADSANMFSFNIKSDAVTISKPVERRSKGYEDGGVTLVKFPHAGKRHEYLFAPADSSSSGNLYDAKNGKFVGVMQKVSNHGTKYKISLKN